jgi:hypothetical protein
VWETKSFNLSEIEFRSLNIVRRNTCFSSVLIALPYLLILEYTETRTPSRKNTEIRKFEVYTL